MANREVARTPDTANLERFLTAGAEVETVDPDAISAEIMQRILNATTAEAVLGKGAIDASSVLNQRLVLRGVRWNKSTKGESGPGFYALLDVANVDGEPMTVTCGSRNVMAQAWRLADLGLLPLGVRIMESPVETAAGGRPMWMELAQ